MNAARRPMLRAAVSVALIAWLAARIDWNVVPGIVRRAHAGPFVLAALLLLVERAVSVWKWWLLLRARRQPVGYGRLFAINYAGNFIGMFLPSSVSTDVLRGVFLARVCADAPTAAASILVDRLTGFLALVMVTAVALRWAPAIPGLPVAALGGWAAGIMAVALAVALGLGSRANRRRLEWIVRRGFGNGRWADRAAAWLNACLVFGRSPGWVTANLMLSAVVQVIRVLTFYALAHAFVDPPPPIISFFLFVPVILLAIMLPVSFSGIGVRENAFVALFGLTGLMVEADAFVVSLAMTLMVALTTLPGVVFYFRGLHAAPGPAATANAPAPGR